jgi:uncharacterized integral membrane protein (TIGR00697 family)
MTQHKNFHHIDTITAFFVAVLIISNVASSKIVAFGPFTFDGGTLLFPLSYIFGDVLTEVYGYKRSRKVLWLGFSSIIVMSLIFMAVGALPAAGDWKNQDAYDKILGLTPRIVLASLIAYFIGEFSNSFVLAKLKIVTKGKLLWTRTIGSTLVGELFDSTIFIVIAFWGVLPQSLLVTLILSNYIFKSLVEIVLTPVTYIVINFLKKIEHEDYFDYKTNFNPFSIKE